MKYLFFLLPYLLFGDLNVILLAGGGGTRLWPASTDQIPKQFLDFGSGESLLQQTIRRLLQLQDLSQIVITTSSNYISLVQKQIEKFEGKTKFSILAEPSRRNTAPAIAYSAKFLSQTASPDDSVLVVPADHLMEPEEEWVRAIESALPSVMHGQIATFGIKPTKPETGFGYLEFGSPYDDSTYTVNRFIEKPNRARAEELIQLPHVFWNSGIFLFELNTFWEELKRHSPEIYALCQTDLENNYNEMPDISIDYAVMEKCDRIVAAPLVLNWSDIGSWDGLYEALEKDSDGNILKGNISHLNAKNSLIFSNKKKVVAIGVEDLLIIETDDALLICKKGESQKLKQVVNANGSIQY